MSVILVIQDVNRFVPIKCLSSIAHVTVAIDSIMRNSVQVIITNALL